MYSQEDRDVAGRVELRAAMEAMKYPVSPQAARGLQATENAWRAMEAEFGLLDIEQVRLLVDPEAQPLLVVRRRHADRYPSFQFDADTGEVRAVIPRLLQIAAKYEVPHEDLAQWLCGPSGWFHEADRPVDHLAEPDRIVEAAANNYGIQW